MVHIPRAFGAPLFLALCLAGAAVGRSPHQAASPAAPAGPAPVDLSTVDTRPWLFADSDITPDPEWHFGTLPNGLRYAVRKNGVPPGQVAIRVRVDAGSLMETDGERGFAHFIEHLSFRGSEYVPDGEAKRVWQRFGATFGSDTNAQTTYTSTTYKLDLPAATAAGLDDSLKILSGMMAHPAITPAALDAERPVVLAEQREQPGPQVRMGDAIRATFFAGQPIADRAPIGTIKTLDAATADAVRAFHDRWYRPSRTVVIISGDMDPAVFAAGIVRHFAGWRGVGDNPADPDFGRPDPSKPAAGAVVEPSLPPVVAMGVIRPWHYNSDTVIFNQKRMVDMLAAQVISRRLETRARAGGSFLQASVSLDDVSRSANVTAVNIVPVGSDWETALKDVRGVIADASTHPATQAEIDREYADLDTGMRTEVETAKVEAGARQADIMSAAIDIRETVASPEVSYKILTDAHAKGMFTPAAVLASTKRIFTGDATRAVVNTRVAEDNSVGKLALALKADVGGLAKAHAQGAVTFARLPPLGKPGTVVSRAPVAGLDMEQIAFANGVHLLLFPNASETGRVYVRVRFGRGDDALPATHESPAWAGDLALMQGGIGKLNQGDLDQMTAGRRIGIDFDIGDDAFSLAGLTSAQDMPDQLRLMASALAHPGWDPAPVVRARAVALTSYDGYAASPDGVLSRDLERLLHDGDPRWGTPPRAAIDALTPAAFRALWQPLVASGPIEVSVFGDFKAADAVAAVAATFGTLPLRTVDPAPAPPVRFPAHVDTPVMRQHDGAANQAVAVIAWPTGAGIDDIRDSRRLDVLAQVFSDRLFEKLRQADGASYSPNVSSSWPIGLPGGGRLLAIGQVAPANVPLFFATARAIAADLVANPIGQDELVRIMGPMRQVLIRSATSSAFWLQLMAGATFDPRRIDATRSVARDFTSITPADLQATAAKYLVPARDWTMAVVPKPVRTGAQSPVGAPGTTR